MIELNYHIPLINKVAAVIDPVDGYLRATLPPYNYPRLLLNAVPAVPLLSGGDFVALTYRNFDLINAYGFHVDGWEMYLDTITPPQLIRDDTIDPFRGSAWRFTVPFYIPANASVISRFTNWDNSMKNRAGVAYAVVRG